MAEQTLKTSIHAAWYLTESRFVAALASFSSVFSSYTDGSMITLWGIQLAKKEIRHSEAEMRMLLDGEVKKLEIRSNNSGSFANVSSGLICAATS